MYFWNSPIEPLTSILASTTPLSRFAPSFSPPPPPLSHHHRYHDGIGLVCHLLFPGLVAKIFLLERTHTRVTRLLGTALYVLENGPPFVEIGQHARAAD